MEIGSTYLPCPQIEPISMPPIDCHTFWPLAMSPSATTTAPSVVVMVAGMGGISWKIRVPIQPRIENEITSTAAKLIQSFFIDVFLEKRAWRYASVHAALRYSTHLRRGDAP